MNKCTGCKYNSVWLGCTKIGECVYTGKENQTTTPGNKTVFIKKAIENQQRKQRIDASKKNKELKKNSKSFLDSITEWLNGNDDDSFYK